MTKLPLTPNDELTAHQRDFMDSHDTHPGGVWIVEVYIHGEHEITGVFTSSEKAEAYAISFGDGAKSVITPYVLDEPYFGNIAQKEMM